MHLSKCFTNAPCPSYFYCWFLSCSVPNLMRSNHLHWYQSLIFFCAHPTISRVLTCVLYLGLGVIDFLRLHICTMLRMFLGSSPLGIWEVPLSLYLPILLHGLFLHIFLWRLHVTYVANFLSLYLNLLHMR
jgi:hypothetical protein